MLLLKNRSRPAQKVPVRKMTAKLHAVQIVQMYLAVNGKLGFTGRISLFTRNVAPPLRAYFFTHPIERSTGRNFSITVRRRFDLKVFANNLGGYAATQPLFTKCTGTSTLI
jgi:hypothetical protein